MEVYKIPPCDRISDEEILAAHSSGKVPQFEDKRNVRMIIADSKFIYVATKTDYTRRRFMVNIPLGIHPRVASRLGRIEVCETRIHENKHRDDTFYTLGNLFGKSSIIMGGRFRDFLASDKLKELLGRGLRDVLFELEGDQFVLKGYAFRD